VKGDSFIGNVAAFEFTSELHNNVSLDNIMILTMHVSEMTISDISACVRNDAVLSNDKLVFGWTHATGF
jgi:hypothetical protein